MCYAQIANHNGLRSLIKSLNASGSCRYHLGIHKELARSTLSYANNHRSCEVFERLFYALRNTLNKGGRKKLRKNLYAIDATEISLNIHDFPWALFRSTIGGIKMHTKYDINNSVPDYLFMTNANIFDMNAADIAKLYRARWNIEIFFKTIKQNLRVKKFYGQSKNAVETQIWIALIVYVLYLKLRQMSTYEGKNFTDFISELKVCLFARFNTPTLCVVIKGIKARLQPPYENNIPRRSASGLLI